MYRSLTRAALLAAVSFIASGFGTGPETPPDSGELDIEMEDLFAFIPFIPILVKAAVVGSKVGAKAAFKVAIKASTKKAKKIIVKEVKKTVKCLGQNAYGQILYAEENGNPGSCFYDSGEYSTEEGSTEEQSEGLGLWTDHPECLACHPDSEGYACMDKESNMCYHTQDCPSGSRQLDPLPEAILNEQSFKDSCRSCALDSARCSLSCSFCYTCGQKNSRRTSVVLNDCNGFLTNCDGNLYCGLDGATQFTCPNNWKCT